MLYFVLFVRKTMYHSGRLLLVTRYTNNHDLLQCHENDKNHAIATQTHCAEN